MKALLVALGVALWLGPSMAFAESAKAEAYPLGTCPISGKALEEGAVVKTYEGREVRFCCEKCPASFESDVAAGLAKVDAAIIADQQSRYPIAECIVMEHDMEMAKAHWFVAGNRAFATCCPSCERKVQAAPADFIATLNEAVIEAQDAAYPLENCVVAGTALDENAVSFVLAGRLIKTCCPGCAAKAKADPAAYISKVDEASKG